MKRINIVQNSPEWLAFRKKRIGASDCPTICGVNPYSTPKKLFDEKFWDKSVWESPAMRRGKMLEPEAREMFERTKGKRYPSATFVHDEYDWMMASLDGYNEEDQEIIEIKCPTSLGYEVTPSYLYQIHHQMKVMELSKATLIIFNTCYFEEFTIQRDEKIIEEIVEKEKHFYECLKRGNYA